jgi:acetylornithine deacetylase/succinyl-diaminopimelate desuccinylase-like protein
VNVPGFYDKVRAIPPAEHTALEKVAWTDEEFFAETGVPAAWGEPGYSRREQVGLRPTLEVNGIYGGFMQPGSKTVLPSRATAKVSCRLVGEQDPHEIFELLKKRVAALTPAAVRSEIRLLNWGRGATVDIGSPAMAAAVTAYERGFGAKPVFLPEGGSIPVVATLQSTFHIPVLLVGMGLPDDNLHAPNERFKIEHFYKGIDTAIALLEKLGEMTPERVRG